MALTRIPRLSLMNARLLYDTMGSATAVFEHRKDIRDVIPEANEKLVEVLRDVDEAIADAEREMEFARKSNIRCLSLNDDAYPLLLKECPDAPLVLYYLGNADLNAQRIINVVGTRKITPMGKDICRSFIADLQKVYPDTYAVPAPRPAYPVTLESRFTDLKQSFMGRILFGAVLSVADKQEKAAEKLSDGPEKDNKRKGAFFLRQILESNSPRSMSMTAGKSMPYNFAQGFVELTNGHLIRGARCFLKKIDVPKLPKEDMV